MTPVHVAAWAWRTPLGAGIPARDRLLRGETALGPPPPALAPYGIARVAPIPGEPAPSPHARYLHRAALFGVEVAMEAASGHTGDRFGLFTALGGLRALWGDLAVAMADQTADADAPWARGLGKVHPYWMLRHLSNNAHALLAIDLGARGEGATLAGPTGGAQALAAALRTLRAGRLDAALVVACDTLLQPEILLEAAVHGRYVEGGPGEAAVAVLLRPGPGDLCVEVESGLACTLEGVPVEVSGLGDVGAAASLAGLVALTGMPAGTWIVDSGGPPGLVARVRGTVAASDTTLPATAPPAR
jgi:hypothetical protein